MIWLYYLLLLFTLSLLSPFLVKFLKNQIGIFISLFFFIGIGVLFFSAENILISWAPDFGLDLSFRLDGLSKLFATVILLVGGCVFLYSSEYLKKSDRLGSFYLSFTLFMSAMLGVVTADNFYLMFIFWELTSISSFFLIGYYHEKESSRRSALQALLITGSGGLCLLAGLLFLQNSTGVTSFSKLLDANFAQDTAIIILILLGGLTKSAQFPFHFWLPNAMAAPAPVSALLHSATMVKAGIYLFLRFDGIFNAHPVWSQILTVIGAMTLVLGAISSYTKKDIKKILAYTTIGTLGALTMLVGLTHQYAFYAALVLFVAHALYKATLFMVAGIIEHKTQTRDILQLSGLRHQLPWVFYGSALAALSMIGVPPFLGFISKEIILKVATDSIWSIPVMVITFSFLGASAWISGIQPFLGPISQSTKDLAITKPKFLFFAGPLVLGIISFILGFDPSSNLENFLRDALSSQQSFLPLHLWTGLHLPLILSLLVLASVGFLVFLHKKITLSASKYLKDEEAFFDRFFWLSFAWFMKRAKYVTRKTQNGEVFLYLIYIFCGVIFGFIYLVKRTNYLEFAPFKIQRWPEVPHLIVFMVALVGCYLVIFAKQKMTAIVSNGCIGFSVAAMFAMLGAPDVAIAQLAVEILSVILFVFLLKENFKLKKQYKGISHAIRVAISITMGLLIFFLTWNAYNQRISNPISDFFGQNSYLQAFGKNVVNVIIVDFRGFDTFGEIVVFSVTALALSVLLKWKKSDKLSAKNSSNSSPSVAKVSTIVGGKDE